METIIDDYRQTVSFKAEWPEYCHIAHLDNGQFQAVAENESLGDYEALEQAAEEIDTWLKKPAVAPDTCFVRVNHFSRELWNEFLGEGKKLGKTVAQILAEAIALWLKKNKK